MGIDPVLMYFVLWQPARTAVKKLHASIPVMHMEAERLRNHASEVEMLRHRPAGCAGCGCAEVNDRKFCTAA